LKTNELVIGAAVIGVGLFLLLGKKTLGVPSEGYPLPTSPDPSIPDPVLSDPIPGEPRADEPGAPGAPLPGGMWPLTLLSVNGLALTGRLDNLWGSGNIVPHYTIPEPIKTGIGSRVDLDFQVYAHKLRLFEDENILHFSIMLWRWEWNGKNYFPYWSYFGEGGIVVAKPPEGESSLPTLSFNMADKVKSGEVYQALIGWDSPHGVPNGQIIENFLEVM